jgi:hypothetical protein
MGKKCLPGNTFCVENMTLFLLFFVGLLVILLLYRMGNKQIIVVQPTPNAASSIFATSLAPMPVRGVDRSVPLVDRSVPLVDRSVMPDPLSNPYVPPVRDDTDYLVRRNNYDLRPIPTQPYDPAYKQIGILTRKQSSTGNNEILPLMGRRQLTSRDKWQYYTVAGGGNGNLQTKLPVSVKGKSCTGEYGCDEIYNNDTVFVEGYKDIFVATVYENNTYAYMP